MKRVFVLGSGFSKAIHHEMPVLVDFLSPIDSMLARSPGPTRLRPNDFGDDVERWLSHLASPPPWVGQAESLRGQALFLDASETIAEVVTTAAIKALVLPMPSWLGDLVRHWRRTEETVLTFNYDTLVERAYMHTTREDDPTGEPRFAVDLYALPLAPLQTRGSSIAGPGRTPSFRLLKLHGSTNWFYSGAGAGPSDTIFDSGLYERQWPDTDSSLVDPDEDLLPADRTPLIIPPVAVKTAFYESSALRVQWQAAAAAISAAEEVVLMGFSVPETDLLVRDLLATNISDAGFVTVVDRNPDLPHHIADVLGTIQAELRTRSVVLPTLYSAGPKGSRAPP